MLLARNKHSNVQSDTHNISKIVLYIFWDNMIKWG